METTAKTTKEEMKRRFQLKKKIRSGIQEQIERGITGRELSKEAFRIKKKEVSLYQRKKLSDYKKITVADKLEIRNQLIESGRIGDFVKIQRRTQLYMLITTTQQLKDIALRSFDVFGTVFANLMRYTENERFPCELQENATAWISKHVDEDKEVIYRYYSKKHGENSGTIGLSIFDLIEIVDSVELDSSKGFRNAVYELAKLLDLDGLKDGWVLSQERKYDRNINSIQIERTEMKRLYPALSSILKAKHIRILEVLNNKGRSHITLKLNHNGEAIFFISTTHIADTLIPDFSQSKVSRAINLLTTLGFLKKVPHLQLAKSALEIADGIMMSAEQNNTKKKGGKPSSSKRKPITFYHIPDYEGQNVFEFAEMMAKRLLTVGLKAESSLTEKNLIKHFGLEFAKRVNLPDYKSKSFQVTTIVEENQSYDNIGSIEEDLPF